MKFGAGEMARWSRRMRIFTIAALSIVMLALPAAVYAQMPGRGMTTKEEPKVNPERQKAVDKAYSESLSRIPSQEFDPWGSVREKTPDPKPPAAKKKPVR
jgi:hypothetical protein